LARLASRTARERSLPVISPFRGPRGVPMTIGLY